MFKINNINPANSSKYSLCFLVKKLDKLFFGKNSETKSEIVFIKFKYK